MVSESVRSVTGCLGRAVDINLSVCCVCAFCVLCMAHTLVLTAWGGSKVLVVVVSPLVLPLASPLVLPLLITVEEEDAAAGRSRGTGSGGGPVSFVHRFPMMPCCEAGGVGAIVRGRGRMVSTRGWSNNDQLKNN